MANAFDVAEFIITISKDFAHIDTSNVKLQKLLYCAQGRYLARTGNPLFDAPIEAWADGPVVKNVYEKYLVYGSDPLPSPSRNMDSALNAQEFDALVDVIGDYGFCSASELRDITQLDGSPWANAFSSKDARPEISNSELQTYFTTVNREPTFKERMEKQGVTVVGRLGPDGMYVMPASEYDPDDDIYESDYAALKKDCATRLTATI
ncbi:MAG: DUF4065 domain-containing protein [Clostridiales bacterium]|nr:DUF4065 domain-containing protein [Clostridiales bacterium]